VVDIRDPRLSDVFAAEKPEVVCHQAARANVRESFEKPLLYAEVNVLGSLNVLECCRGFNIRKMIYASTGGAVYGSPSSFPSPKSTRLIRSIHTAPASTMWSITCTCTRKTSASRTHRSAIQMCTAPGRIPSERRESSPFLPGRCWTKASWSSMDRGAGKGFVSVTDIARANLLALNKGDGEIMNIGSGVATSINTIFSSLADLTGYREKAVYGPAKAGEVYRIYLNADRAKEILGWTPKVSLKEALELRSNISGKASNPNLILISDSGFRIPEFEIRIQRSADWHPPKTEEL